VIIQFTVQCNKLQTKPLVISRIAVWNILRHEVCCIIE